MRAALVFASVHERRPESKINRETRAMDVHAIVAPPARQLSLLIPSGRYQRSLQAADAIVLPRPHRRRSAPCSCRRVVRLVAEEAGTAAGEGSQRPGVTAAVSGASPNSTAERARRGVVETRSGRRALKSCRRVHIRQRLVAAACVSGMWSVAEWPVSRQPEASSIGFNNTYDAIIDNRYL